LYWNNIYGIVTNKIVLCYVTHAKLCFWCYHSYVFILLTGSGSISQKISHSSTYYVAIGNMKPQNVKVVYENNQHSSHININTLDSTSYGINEAWIFLRLGVFRCRTHVGVQHGHDTYNYTELCHFLKLLSVSACQCPVSVSLFHSLHYSIQCIIYFHYEVIVY